MVGPDTGVVGIGLRKNDVESCHSPHRAVLPLFNNVVLFFSQADEFEVKINFVE